MDWVKILVKLFVCVVEVFLIYDLHNNITNKRNKIRGKKVLLISLIVIVLLFLVNSANNSSLNLICFPIIMLSYVYILFELGIRERIYYFVVAFSINIGCEFLYAIITQLSAKVMMSGEAIDLSYNIMHVIAVKLITFIAYTIVKQFSSKTIKVMDNKTLLTYMCLPIATLGMMLTVFYSGIDFQKIGIHHALMTIFMLLMLGSNMLVYFAFARYSREVNSNAENSMLIMKQNEELEYLHKTVQRNEKHQELIHDTSNYIKIIESLVKDGENEKVDAVLKDLTEELENSVMSIYSFDTILNTILSEKSIDAGDTGVEYDVLVEPNVNVESIKEIDLIAMFGNLLDNAIRGASECEDNKYVKLRIYMQNENNILVFKCINSCTGNIQVENEKFLTTKEDKNSHGFGIKSVLHIAEKYNGILDLNVVENVFTSTLVLNINNK